MTSLVMYVQSFCQPDYFPDIKLILFPKSMILSRLLILTGFLQCLATDGISVNSFSSRNVAKIRSLLKGIENQNEADEAIIVLFKSPVGSVGSVTVTFSTMYVIQMGTTPDILLI